MLCACARSAIEQQALTYRQGLQRVAAAADLSKSGGIKHGGGTASEEVQPLPQVLGAGPLHKCCAHIILFVFLEYSQCLRPVLAAFMVPQSGCMQDAHGNGTEPSTH